MRRTRTRHHPGCQDEECVDARLYERGSLREDPHHPEGDFLEPQPKLSVDKRRNIRQFPPSGGYQSRNANGTNTFAQIIPIRINYQMDIFTVDKITGDELVRELIFHIMQNPTLTVDVPYNLNMEHKFNLFLESDVVNNSDTIEHVDKGVKFRNTLTFYTDDAYLFASREQLHGNVTGRVDAKISRKEG